MNDRSKTRYVIDITGLDVIHRYRQSPKLWEIRLADSFQSILLDLSVRTRLWWRKPEKKMYLVFRNPEDHLKATLLLAELQPPPKESSIFLGALVRLETIGVTVRCIHPPRK